jgi:hypothetical protein
MYLDPLDSSLNQWFPNIILPSHLRAKTRLPSILDDVCDNDTNPQQKAGTRKDYKKKLGIKIARCVKRINNSQFADVTLLLGGASHVMAQIFKIILDLYEQASRGIINKHKSQIYAWNVKAGKMERIAQIL